MTPTARTLALLRKRGLLAATVERWNSHAHIRHDLFGFADVLACGADAGIVLVQTTTANNASKRLAKMLAEPRLRRWLLAGGKVELHSWAKRGPRGGRKTWTCAVREVGLADLPAVAEVVRPDERGQPKARSCHWHWEEGGGWLTH